jgi:hypothetical protein
LNLEIEVSKFTPTYQKAQDVFAKQKFASPEWDKFLTQTCPVASLFGAVGFDAGKAALPQVFRKKLTDSAKHTNKVAIFILGGGPGQVIYEAAQNKSSVGTWIERAAALKMVQHVYHAQKKGGQNVWVYSPPKSHAKPIFDELKGTDGAIKSKLDADEEIFSVKDRELMCDALALSRKIAMDAQIKVNSKTAEAKKVVKRWFLNPACTDVELNDAFTKLSAGMKKITAACSSTTMVFTDYLDWRKKRDDYYGGAFRGGEGGGFPVIYLEGAFTRLKGNSGKLWLCAETILHELSHHEVQTEDHRYDSSGLKPTDGNLPYAKTIENADSWGYFMLDLAGYLSASDLAKTWK